MAKRQKVEKIDGFGPRERSQVTSAIRQVWQRSKARATAVKRCTDKQGYTWCEKCRGRTPKIKVDHITPAGAVDSVGYINRMFCPSKLLQCICKECHDIKTAIERAQSGDSSKAPRKRKQFTDLF